MNLSEPARQLTSIPLSALPRLGDRIPYLHIDRARVEQGRTGVEAWSEGKEGEFVRTTLPAAGMGALLLGPGTSISAPAAATLYRCGTSVLFTDGSGMVAYATARPLTSSARWAAAQARAWADPRTRREVARQLYLKRYPGTEVPEGISLAALRGLEGRAVRKTYQAMAKRYAVPFGRRNSTDPQDRVNICLNIANASLYGMAAAVCSTLSLNPALGFVHSGPVRALLYDLADVYKEETSIPAAFEAARDERGTTKVHRLLRNRVHKFRVMHRMLDLTVQLIEPYLDESDDRDVLMGDGEASAAEMYVNHEDRA